MPPRSTTLAVVGFYAIFLVVVIGGAYLFSRSSALSDTASSTASSSSGGSVHESGYEAGSEGSDGYDSSTIGEPDEERALLYYYA
ncbi:hypothetical protein PG985_009697 [Apiospora marii]|uniref:Uncharacterized protein n=1 Tax=Apiospora marii TaxID=335849 RepID=A0ABR1RG08_9PEZI